MPQAARPTRFVHLDYFRGVAILMIILGHCYHTWQRDTFFEIAASNIVTGGTALFVFVSGFFYKELFFDRMPLRSFLIKKARFVLLPYAIMSVFGLLTFLAVEGELSDAVPKALGQDPGLALHTALNLLTGGTIVAYWYVPFVMLIFALSPLFDLFIRLSTKIRIGLVAVGFLLAMYIQRPVADVNTLHSVIYFAPFYALGILYALHRAAADVWIARYLPWIVAFMLLTTLLMSGVGQIGNLHKALPWRWTGLDLMVVQKIALILCILGLLRRFEHVPMPRLRHIADASFALFFLHPWVIAGIKRGFFDVAIFELSHVLILFVATLVTCLVTARMAKAILGKNSRQIIGW